MKLLIDACISTRVIAPLRGIYTEITHVFDCGDISADDGRIWDFAKQNNFTIVTKDTDFHRMSFLYGAPPKVVWLRIGNAGTTEIIALLTKRVSQIRRFEADPQASLLIIDV